MHFSLFLVIWVCVWLPARAGAELFALGLVHEGKETYFDLHVKNESPDDLTFLTSSTTCDCVRLLALPSLIRPGESAIIPCVYLPTSVGRVAIEVKITSASSDALIKTFGLSGFVAKKEWMVSSEELIADTAGKFTIIDVREASKFSKTRIPRSINLPLFAIKARQALKEKLIVLVEDGAPSAEMLEEVQRLSSQGFRQMQILQGGLASWLRKSDRTEGSDSAAVAAASISPAEFDRSARVFAWHILEANEALGADGVARVVQQSLQDQNARNILIVAPREDAYQAIETGLAAAGDRRSVYYLRGGKKALDDWRSSQAELANHTGQLVQVRPSTAHPAASGRCGSCGAK